jgi:hypothetical protein
MYHDSFYTKINQSTEKRINQGYDYNTNGVLNSFVSPILYGNPRLATFLNKIDRLFVEIIESVKKLQFYQNYTIDKNDRRLNQ